MRIINVNSLYDKSDMCYKPEIITVLLEALREKPTTSRPCESETSSVYTKLSNTSYRNLLNQRCHNNVQIGFEAVEALRPYAFTTLEWRQRWRKYFV